MKPHDPPLPSSPLQANPFATNTDPRFLWPGKPYQDAVAALTEGILGNAGLVLLTGQAGTGKTTLTNALIDRLGEAAVVARLSYPTLAPSDFYQYLATAFTVQGALPTRASFLAQFSDFLSAAARKGRRVLLVIDDAQSLSQALLDEIRHLTSLAREAGLPLSILLVGQEELTALLQMDHPELHEKVHTRCRLRPLNEDETGEYIRHRLRIAGAEEGLFSADAMQAMFASSGGIPGLINIIGDLALLSVHGREAKPIGAEIVRECAGALGFVSTEREPHHGISGPEPGRDRRRDTAPALWGVGERVARSGPWRWRGPSAVLAVLLIALGASLAAYLRFPSRGREVPPGSLPLDARETANATAPEERAGGNQPSAPAPPGPQEPGATRRTETEAPPAVTPPRSPVRAGRSEASSQEQRLHPDGKVPAGPEEKRADLAAGPRDTLPEDPDSPDPTGVIDWLLQESAAQRR